MFWHSVKLQNNLLLEEVGNIISLIHLEQNEAKHWMEHWMNFLATEHHKNFMKYPCIGISAELVELV